MKKAVLFTIALGVGITGWAQKKNVNTAQAALGREEYDKAKSAIDAAVSDETTKDDPKTWFVRGEVYTALENVPAHKAADPAQEAARSYIKAAELDPSFRKEDMDARLLKAAQVYFNQGIEEYQKKDYAKAYDAFSWPLTIGKLGDGKRFASVPTFDTIMAYAWLQRGFSAYMSGDYAKAQPDLMHAKDNPITRDANVYLALVEIAQKGNRQQEATDMITEGRKAFPDNTDLRNAELNMYLKSGNQDVLLKKLEEAVAKEPENPELLFNLGNGYNNLAFPKDANGKDQPRPANYATLVAKAEEAYLKAISLDKQNKPEYSYNLGALYFNQASAIINEMNALGTSAADQKKYDELAVQRDAMFGKALPHLEKVFQSLDANAGKLNAEDGITYQSVIIALREIYAKQNKMDKVSEMKNKLEAYKSK